jgi:hypothetical protein
MDKNNFIHRLGGSLEDFPKFFQARDAKMAPVTIKAGVKAE